MSLLQRAERYARRLEKQSLSRRSRLLLPETRTEAQDDHPEIPASDGAAIKVAVEKKLLRKQGLSEISLENGTIIPGVSEAEGDIIPTGIPGLDNQISGFSAGINLLTGTPGSGKTILAMQFLMNGIDSGETGLYISFEEKKDNFFKYMGQFGWDLQDMEDREMFAFLRFSPERALDILSDGKVESIVKRLGVKRICIDSLSAFAVLAKDTLSARDSVTGLLDLVRSLGVTAVITGEQANKKSSSVLDFDTDSVISLITLRSSNVRQRVADAMKVQGGPKLLPMKIGDTGVSFYELI